MPIHGLTDRPAAFPRIGELRKGAERTPDDIAKKRPGKDQRFFRFTSTDPKDSGLAKLFADTIGEKPTLIYVLLPAKTPEENLDAWQEEWTAGSLKHRCDGKTVVLELAEGGRVYRMNPGTPCPGGCKATGRLGVILPQLKRAGIVTVLTTSKNDLLNLSRSLDAAYSLRGDLRGIPFALSRVPRMISTPAENGKRARREKWLLHLEIAPQWFERQLAVLQSHALPQAAEAPLMLEGGFDEPDEDEPVQADSHPDAFIEPEATEDSRPLESESPGELTPDTTSTPISAEGFQITRRWEVPQNVSNDRTMAWAYYQALREEVLEKKGREIVSLADQATPENLANAIKMIHGILEK